MLLGWLALTTLSLLALWAAAGLAARLEPAELAERATAVALVWTALITLPVLALGWSGLLHRSTLAAAVALLAVASSLVACLGRGFRAHARATLGLLAKLVQAPWLALVDAWQARSVAFLLLLALYASLFWTAWLSYLGASNSWDGLWYHDSIVGYAIQNHGFSLVSLPRGMDYVNSFPKVCEALNLWFVIFTDRRLIELPNNVMSPMFVAASYAIIRRFVDDRVLALGWTCALFLIPGVLLQLRSTYIDLHVAALYMAATCFCSRPELRLRDAWLGGLALALLGGSKGHALIWVPILATFASLRLVRQHLLSRPIGMFLTLSGVALLVTAVAGPTYVRNWIAFDNPIWPMHFQSERLGITFRGTQYLEDLRWTYDSVLREALGHPLPGGDFTDIRYTGYGALPWLVLPLAALALPWAVARSVFRWRSGEAGRARNLIACTLPLLLTAPLSPVLWSARYNLHVAAALVFLASWLTTGPRLRRLAEGVVAATGVWSLMRWHWADPGWSVDRAQASDLLSVSAAERAAAQTIHWAGEPEVLLKREQELQAGDTVVFSDDFRFPSVLWNERFSNRVVYVSSLPLTDFLSRLDQQHAKWVTVSEGSTVYKTVSDRPTEWQPVGALIGNQPKIVAFRRITRE